MSLLDTPEILSRRARTAAAFDNPQPGDRFTEMYAWWLFVLDAAPDGGPVTTIEASAPCTLPDDGTVRTFPTAAAFRAHFAYGTIPGYPMQLVDQGTDVTGWAEAGKPYQEPLKAAPSPVSHTAVCEGCGKPWPCGG